MKVRNENNIIQKKKGNRKQEASKENGRPRKKCQEEKRVEGNEEILE